MTLQKRFKAKIDFNHPSGCHIWMGAIAKAGYGYFWINNKLRGAHRVAWEFAYGAISPKMHVCHHCDNRACVNPTHLFLGTNADNVADRITKGRARGNWRKGEVHPKAKLTLQDVLTIRSSENSHATLGRKYGGGKSTICYIRARKTWRHL
jgi:HNH endonuclease